MIYEVRSLDMWGHVSADCAEHDCPCVVDGEHDDNRCDCHEVCNQQFYAGEIEVPSNASDDAVLDALHAEGFLTDLGRKVACVEDYSDGPLDVSDAEGRLLFYLLPAEDES